MGWGKQTFNTKHCCMWEWSESLVRRVDRCAMVHLWQWAAMYRNPVRGRESVYKADLRNPGSRPRVGACSSQREAEGLQIWQTNLSPWKVISLHLHPPHSTPATSVSFQVTFKWLPSSTFIIQWGGVCACTTVFFLHVYVCMRVCWRSPGGRQMVREILGAESVLKKTWASLRSL